MSMAAPKPYWPHYGYAAHYPADLLPATLQAGLVTYPNGAVVPHDTPSVAAAKAAHLSYKFGIWGR